MKNKKKCNKTPVANTSRTTDQTRLTTVALLFTYMAFRSVQVQLTQWHKPYHGGIQQEKEITTFGVKDVVLVCVLCRQKQWSSANRIFGRFVSMRNSERRKKNCVSLVWVCEMWFFVIKIFNLNDLCKMTVPLVRIMTEFRSIMINTIHSWCCMKCGFLWYSIVMNCLKWHSWCLC